MPRTKESGIERPELERMVSRPEREDWSGQVGTLLVHSEARLARYALSLEAERDALRERRRPVTPDEWRDELGQFLHAYLLDNEPQVHPVSLATAVWEWLHSQSPPYEAAVAEIERLRETLVLVAEAVVNGEWEAARELSDAVLERTS